MYLHSFAVVDAVAYVGEAGVVETIVEEVADVKDAVVEDAEVEDVAVVVFVVDLEVACLVVPI